MLRYVINFFKDFKKKFFHSTSSDWRKTSDYTQWKKAVRQRYGNRCAVTNKTSNLHCHHLDNANSFPKKRFRVDNGILIHSKVHQHFHVQFMGGYHHKTTKADWERYVSIHRKEFKKLSKYSSYYDLLIWIGNITVYGIASILVIILLFLIMVNG